MKKARIIGRIIGLVIAVIIWAIIIIAFFTIVPAFLLDII